MQNKEKMFLSKTTGKNGSVKEAMHRFSSPASRRRSNPFTLSQIISVCYRKPRNDVDFFALALLVIHYQNVNIRLILWNYLKRKLRYFYR